MTTPIEQEQEEATSRRPMDAEIRSMSAILRIIDELDEAAKVRVITYVAARFRGPA